MSNSLLVLGVVLGASDRLGVILGTDEMEGVRLAVRLGSAEIEGVTLGPVEGVRLGVRLGSAEIEGVRLGVRLGSAEIEGLSVPHWEVSLRPAPNKVKLSSFGQPSSRSDTPSPSLSTRVRAAVVAAQQSLAEEIDAFSAATASSSFVSKA